MKTVLILAALFGIQAAAQEEAKPCDMSDIQDSFYCEECGLLEKDQVEEGACKECSKEGEKAEASKVKVCVKEYYECGCSKTSDKPSKCCSGLEMEKKISRAIILYLCEECGAEGDSEGPCEGEECKKAGKRIKKTCQSSGEFPHTGK